MKRIGLPLFFILTLSMVGGFRSEPAPDPVKATEAAKNSPPPPATLLGMAAADAADQTSR